MLAAGRVTLGAVKKLTEMGADLLAKNKVRSAFGARHDGIARAIPLRCSFPSLRPHRISCGRIASPSSARAQCCSS
eukprot:scaffold162933_cov25-Tisochrysis_lutea.AAC.1